jgi:type IV pilus assembly protein PilW
MRAPRGFTLIEMMVAAVVASLAIAMTMGIFLSQNQTFISLDMARVASGNGRDAVLEMETSLRRAGFGVDPVVAFDFSCPSGSNCHDRVNAPDDITFYARNPEYVWAPFNPSLGCGNPNGCFGSGNVWPITGTTTGGGNATVSVTLRPGDVIHKGRILLAVCQNGQSPVFATATGRTTGPGPAMITVTINTSSNSGIYAGTGFQTCHGNGSGAALFLVDKFHYFVTTLSGEPWLVLDTGLDYNADGSLPPTDVNDLIPVARDVEDMQVAYQIGQPVVPPFIATGAPDSNHDWVIGDDPGIREEPSIAATPPQTGLSSGTMHPGNIRAVRVTLGIRSSTVDSSIAAPGGGDVPLSAENRTDLSAIAVSQFKRYPQTFSVATRNMSAANPYLFF